MLSVLRTEKSMRLQEGVTVAVLAAAAAPRAGDDKQRRYSQCRRSAVSGTTAAAAMVMGAVGSRYHAQSAATPLP